MSNENKGLASQSKERRIEIASKGGKTVFEKGTGHLFDVAEARRAGLKSSMAKKFKNIKLCALRLMVIYNFKPEELAKLNLTAEEYTYYGGVNSNDERIEKLRAIVDNGDSNDSDSRVPTTLSEGT